MRQVNVRQHMAKTNAKKHTFSNTALSRLKNAISRSSTGDLHKKYKDKHTRDCKMERSAKNFGNVNSVFIDIYHV